MRLDVLQYRSHTLYSLTAFIATCGAGDFVSDSEVAASLSAKVHAAAKRLDLPGAFDELECSVTQKG